MVQIEKVAIILSGLRELLNKEREERSNILKKYKGKTSSPQTIAPQMVLYHELDVSQST